jgi:hypothetical protein
MLISSALMDVLLPPLPDDEVFAAALAAPSGTQEGGSPAGGFSAAGAVALMGAVDRGNSNALAAPPNNGAGSCARMPVHSAEKPCPSRSLDRDGE